MELAKCPLRPDFRRPRQGPPCGQALGELGHDAQAPRSISLHWQVTSTAAATLANTTPLALATEQVWPTG